MKGANNKRKKNRNRNKNKKKEKKRKKKKICCFTISVIQRHYQKAL